jgi:hypothetical protein
MISEETKALRQLYAENVQRINSLELSVTQLRSSVPLIAQHDYQLSILSAKVGLLQQPTTQQHGTRPKCSTATVHSIDIAEPIATQTYATSLAIHGAPTVEPNVKNTCATSPAIYGATSQPHPVWPDLSKHHVDLSNTRRCAAGIDEALHITVSNKDNKPDPDNNDTTLNVGILTVSDKNDSRIIHVSQGAKTPPADDELTGFIPVKGKPRYTSIFVSGIEVKNGDMEKTIQRVFSYVENKGCVVKNVRKIKENGNITSVKINVGQNDVDRILQDGFWPEGIYCRLWIN